jgi:hypothetical protein
LNVTKNDNDSECEIPEEHKSLETDRLGTECNQLTLIGQARQGGGGIRTHE